MDEADRETERKKEIVAKCQGPVIGCTTATVQMYHERGSLKGKGFVIRLMVARG